MTTERPDNGARALAERLHETASRNHNLGEGLARAICDQPESHEPRAAAILANGAVFLPAEKYAAVLGELDSLRNALAKVVEQRDALPDAAELERLRRIEAAAPMLLIAIDNAGLESLAEAADEAGAEVPDWQERLWDAADAYRLATEPEGSAGG